jgi:type IX secretion system PorP/SprF family membrane protein
MKQLLLFIVFYSFVFLAKAQDPHFSQFFASPLTLNPAFTGKFNGNYRAAINHRNQWPEINNAFVTSTGSIDFQVLKNKMNSNDVLGVGFNFLSDNSANGAVKFNYISGSSAFHKSLDEDGNKTFSVGLQATSSNFLINTTKLVFEDQLTTLGFTNPNTGETFNGNTLQKSYIDVNVGLLYNNFNPESQSSYYVGLSIYHVNRPQINFTGLKYLLNPRYTLHGGGFYPFSEVVGLHISGLHSSQAGSTETLLGGAFQLNTGGYYSNNPVLVYVGSWYRFNDALIPYIGLEFSNTRLGLSYDVTTSNLKTAAVNRGGIELSLIYTNQPNTDRPINCPKF